nr:MAG TPA: hypothetical protein [Microviridae sp.]
MILLRNRIRWDRTTHLKGWESESYLSTPSIFHKMVRM